MAVEVRPADPGGRRRNLDPPEEWSTGLVGFRPTAVFDASQTEGEPLPELETVATGDASDLRPTLTDAANISG